MLKDGGGQEFTLASGDYQKLGFAFYHLENNQVYIHAHRTNEEDIYQWSYDLSEPPTATLDLQMNLLQDSSGNTGPERKYDDPGYIEYQSNYLGKKSFVRFKDNNNMKYLFGFYSNTDSTWPTNIFKENESGYTFEGVLRFEEDEFVMFKKESTTRKVSIVNRLYQPVALYTPLELSTPAQSLEHVSSCVINFKGKNTLFR